MINTVSFPRLHIFWPDRVQYCWRSYQASEAEDHPDQESRSWWTSFHFPLPHMWKADLQQPDQWIKQSCYWYDSNRVINVKQCTQLLSVWFLPEVGSCSYHFFLGWGLRLEVWQHAQTAPFEISKPQKLFWRCTVSERQTHKIY